MMEIQAAIGREQLKLMPEWHELRLSNYDGVTEACRSIVWLDVPELPATSEHAAYRAYAMVNPKLLPTGWNRDRVIKVIADRGIPVFSGTCSEIYNEKAFDDSGFKPSIPLKNAKKLGEISLMFLVHPTLTEDEIDKTCSAISPLSSVIV